MSYGIIENPKFHILEYLDASALYLLNTKDNLGKFDSKADEGIFLGYSTSSKAYRIFNKGTLVVEESMHVIFNESNSLDPRKDICSVNNDIGEPLETNVQEENASKTLEFEGPNKEDIEETP